MQTTIRMTTTQKHRRFVSEPIYDKGVRAVPGIGKVYGEDLTVAGYGTAQSLLDQFLHLQRNEVLFKQWLNRVCGANITSQGDCYSGLNDWCIQFLDYVKGPYSV